jgi:hypothetical protein
VEVFMVRKLAAAAALAFSLGVAVSSPAPAIDYICSCSLCTSSTQTLGCRDPRNSYRFTSCGTFHNKYC